MTIYHSLDALAGSVTKLQILPINQLTAVNNISMSNTINYADIVISGSFDTIEVVPEAGFKIKTADTINGPLRSLEINGAIMNDDDNIFLNLMYNRYVALITDGNGKRWLVGNRIEYLKYEFDIDFKTLRAANKVNNLVFKGAITTAFLQVL